jgi:hypothetical protein
MTRWSALPSRCGSAVQASRAQALVVGPLTLQTLCNFQPKNKGPTANRVVRPHPSARNAGSRSPVRQPRHLAVSHRTGGGAAPAPNSRTGTGGGTAPPSREPTTTAPHAFGGRRCRAGRRCHTLPVPHRPHCCRASRAAAPAAPCHWTSGPCPPTPGLWPQPLAACSADVCLFPTAPAPG